MIVPIPTVSVIETGADFNILSMRSWHESNAGNEAAQETFKQIALETTDMDLVDIEEALNDGIIEVGEGAIIICHSLGKVGQ